MFPPKFGEIRVEVLESEEALRKRQLTMKEDRSDSRMDKLPSHHHHQTKTRLDVKVLEDSLVENIVKVLKVKLSSVVQKHEKLRNQMLPLTEALQESEEHLKSAKSELGTRAMENKSLLKLNDDQKEELKVKIEINNKLEAQLKEVEDQNVHCFLSLSNVTDLFS